MIQKMRTTVTLDPDTEQVIRRAMRERGLTFKKALNDAVRAGAGPATSDDDEAELPTFDMGEPLVDVTKALRIASELEDQDLARELAQGR